MWECGLKHICIISSDKGNDVTPYVGVWIETTYARYRSLSIGVTPYVGVWIETTSVRARGQRTIVTPYVGVWIETAQSWST